MVHVEHASLTSRAVVASRRISEEIPFGLETMAKQTVSPFSVITLFRKEPPVDGHLSGITENSPSHAPK